jgi:hypothetical protein
MAKRPFILLRSAAWNKFAHDFFFAAPMLTLFDPMAQPLCISHVSASIIVSVHCWFSGALRLKPEPTRVPVRYSQQRRPATRKLSVCSSKAAHP